ncbi:MAG: 4Fe-4S dicluster domain-containing protein [Deltaproteobacteria bacterium]|jgi:molybdopterin-containing oxidoreductase family iron-sulfur binding subunit|nr:4Fe-4S dicluster domain-containing protein [Deltaproteobacteria bacterium]MBT4266998.1 4Fe-4S dicluster domain-containing protein [Deltaproteobacteria bacterium]MBT4639719.1 4Fe-4S dicluster domain-containing protein [Deltaproteobacteria bacterium]MBT6504184.1 4Fe-4S dicluster domain-containing protein [Deltaproteobacteria bacterium]MBT6616133.1 4Fe-4S dicluster domain-containing protein [Deltaproteobacteria bacterium]
MEDSRREFLKKAGVGSLVGLGVVSAITVVAEKTSEASSNDYVDASGTRFGMVVDTKKCIEGCTVCSDVCHTIHNVPDHRLADGKPDLKNEIKWIWKEPHANTFPSKSGQFLSNDLAKKKHVVLCNHCKNPPCVRVCPTQATFKRKDGIVLMDFHRCIGCRFCMAACPYGSRSFNWKDPRETDSMKVIGRDSLDREFPTRERGVVEKCNLCAERLAKGLIPACAEKCPGKAITFGDLNDENSKIREVLASNSTIQRKSELGTGPSVFYIV